MEERKIIEFISSHFGEKIKIKTQWWDLIAILLQEQHQENASYIIKTLEGDITDVEINGKQEKIHVWKIVDVQEAA